MFLWDVKQPTSLFEKSRGHRPGGVANLYGLWDWVGMAPRMGPESVRAHSLWAGLCPEKLLNKYHYNPNKTDYRISIFWYSMFSLYLSLQSQSYTA